MVYMGKEKGWKDKENFALHFENTKHNISMKPGMNFSGINIPLLHPSEKSCCRDDGNSSEMCLHLMDTLTAESNTRAPMTQNMNLRLQKLT